MAKAKVNYGNVKKAELIVYPLVDYYLLWGTLNKEQIEQEVEEIKSSSLFGALGYTYNIVFFKDKAKVFSLLKTRISDVYVEYEKQAYEAPLFLTTLTELDTKNVYRCWVYEGKLQQIVFPARVVNLTVFMNETLGKGSAFVHKVLSGKGVNSVSLDYFSIKGYTVVPSKNLHLFAPLIIKSIKDSNAVLASSVLGSFNAIGAKFDDGVFLGETLSKLNVEHEKGLNREKSLTFYNVKFSKRLNLSSLSYDKASKVSFDKKATAKEIFSVKVADFSKSSSVIVGGEYLFSSLLRRSRLDFVNLFADKLSVLENNIVKEDGVSFYSIKQNPLLFFNFPYFVRKQVSLYESDPEQVEEVVFLNSSSFSDDDWYRKYKAGGTANYYSTLPVLDWRKTKNADKTTRYSYALTRSSSGLYSRPKELLSFAKPAVQPFKVELEKANSLASSFNLEKVYQSYDKYFLDYFSSSGASLYEKSSFAEVGFSYCFNKANNFSFINLVEAKVFFLDNAASFSPVETELYSVSGDRHSFVGLDYLNGVSGSKSVFVNLRHVEEEFDTYFVPAIELYNQEFDLANTLALMASGIDEVSLDSVKSKITANTLENLGIDYAEKDLFYSSLLESDWFFSAKTEEVGSSLLNSDYYFLSIGKEEKVWLPQSSQEDVIGEPASYLININEYDAKRIIDLVHSKGIVYKDYFRYYYVDDLGQIHFYAPDSAVLGKGYTWVYDAWIDFFRRQRFVAFSKPINSLMQVGYGYTTPPKVLISENKIKGLEIPKTFNFNVYSDEFFDEGSIDTRNYGYPIVDRAKVEIREFKEWIESVGEKFLFVYGLTYTFHINNAMSFKEQTFMGCVSRGLKIIGKMPKIKL